jgi:hypothetical protein
LGTFRSYDDQIEKMKKDLNEKKNEIANLKRKKEEDQDKERKKFQKKLKEFQEYQEDVLSHKPQMKKSPTVTPIQSPQLLPVPKGGEQFFDIEKLKLKVDDELTDIGKQKSHTPPHISFYSKRSEKKQTHYQKKPEPPLIIEEEQKGEDIKDILEKGTTKISQETKEEKKSEGEEKQPPPLQRIIYKKFPPASKFKTKGHGETLLDNINKAFENKHASNLIEYAELFEELDNMDFWDKVNLHNRSSQAKGMIEYIKSKLIEQQQKALETSFSSKTPKGPKGTKEKRSDELKEFTPKTKTFQQGIDVEEAREKRIQERRQLRKQSRSQRLQSKLKNVQETSSST